MFQQRERVPTFYHPVSRRTTKLPRDEDFQAPEKAKRTQEYLERQLSDFRVKWVENSIQQGYAYARSSLSIIGALGYGLCIGVQDVSRAPVSPAAWMVLSSLQSAGVGENLNDRDALEIRVEDFVRDHRFHDENTVRLRLGFKYLPPVTLREMARPWIKKKETQGFALLLSERQTGF